MTRTLASIDIGSHTARLLVAQNEGGSELLVPLARRRAYIHLAQGFAGSGNKVIQASGIDQTLKVLEDFLDCIKGFDVQSVHAVATGVARQASNNEELLNRIYEHTGIRVRLISGAEEASLSAKGVLHALDIKGNPFLLFDLGGGSTEFLLDGNGVPMISSIPLGAVILTEEYIGSDPPEEEELLRLSRHIDEVLKEVRLPTTKAIDHCVMVGTGGTVTTLSAMLYRICLTEITPERINGLILEKQQLETLFGNMKKLSIEQRLRLPGVGRGRAEVILAGCLAVIKILRYFRSPQFIVSLADLLEGVLIDCIEGEENGER